MMEPWQLEKEYRIHVYETGPDGRLAKRLNFTMHHLPCSAEINYLAESIFDDEIVVRTLKEEGSNGFFVHSVLRAGDNKELCRIRLGWKEDSIQQDNRL
jgi:acyl-CoA thioesterase FadM